MKLILSTIVVVTCLLSTNLQAQPKLNPYPDPGYRLMGIYAGKDERYFDYQLVKLELGDAFPDKASWWANLKAEREGRRDARQHDIFLVFCGERDADLETVKRRLDAWLAPEQDCPTYPKLIPAICLGEENTGDRNPVLDGLARHVRDTYGVPVFQWYSDPSGPDPNLTADGWIWDSYAWTSVRFRKHLMKFVVLGKPAICVPWATDPHWPQWTQYPTAEALIDAEWLQFDISREFNVSCAPFCVAGPAGSVNSWIASHSEEMIKLRGALRLKRQEMHSIPPAALPLASANFSVRDHSVAVGGDLDSPSVYEESFSGFEWLHAADVRGFLDLTLTSRPEEPGFLVLKGEKGKPTSASLVYRFESYFPLESVEVSLDAAADSHGRNALAISTDEFGNEWPLEAVRQGTSNTESIVLRDNGTLKGSHVFLVRITMENSGTQTGMAKNRLDHLRVRCIHQPPPNGSAAIMTTDLNDNVNYRDDFQSNRWSHLGQLKVDHATHGGYRDGQFWVGSKGGSGTTTHLVQRFSLALQPLKQLAVTADCFADGQNLGGEVTLAVGPRGGKPKWETKTQGIHRGPLTHGISAAELGTLTEFDVHVVLNSGSGVELGEKACATLDGLTIQAK